ncbi:helix-turn-helix transcriptional regulator [Actinobaculum sp. 313]|uniref:response regulator transcription factor n=1 Tax=Actinobaculum sp. 313 TaxID=2495645 RepID=UPI000D52A59F|nr:helix-turn-helix transcriptional regulator [Actinobaculum sp. 313]AWE42327.1 hypothetical protein DDD63_05685 [Actinobaculum sp. 313]
MIALYYYTLAVLLISIAAAAGCLAAFVVTHRQTYGWAAAAFALYFLDVALVFRTDFVLPHRKVSCIYEINSPVESVALGSCLLTFFWLVVANFLGKDHRIAIAPPLVFACGSLAALLLVPGGRWMEFTFFSMRTLSIIALLTYLALCYAVSEDPAERAHMRQHCRLYLAVWICVVGTIVWNVYFQLIHDWESGSPLPFLPERNFAENALLLCCAAHAWRRVYRALHLRYEQPPRYAQNDRRSTFICESATSFGSHYNLSPREIEVLCLILLGHDNRTIADTLFLALSTVKVHVHNILRKSGCSNRADLTRRFWHSS